MNLVKNSFMGDAALIYEYLQREVVQRLLEEHASGRRNRHLFIWSMLMLETWLRHFQHPSTQQSQLQSAPSSKTVST